MSASSTPIRHKKRAASPTESGPLKKSRNDDLEASSNETTAPDDESLNEDSADNISSSAKSQNNNIEDIGIAGRILNRRLTGQRMVGSPKKRGRAIGEGSGSPRKKDGEYSTHPRTKSERDRRNALSPDARRLEQAHGRDRNARFYALTNLKKTNEWKEASKEDRERLEEETVEDLLAKRYRLGQSAEWLEDQMRRRMDEMKEKARVEEEIEEGEDLMIAKLQKGEGTPVKMLIEGAHPTIGEAAARNLSLVVRRWERINYFSGRHSLETAGDPDPRSHIRQFRQQVMEPENILNFDETYAIPEGEDQTLDTNVSKSLKEIETPEGVHVFLSDDEGSNLALGEEDDDGWIVASDEESVLEEYSDDPSIDIPEDQITGHDKVVDEETQPAVEDEGENAITEETGAREVYEHVDDSNLEDENETEPGTTKTGEGADNDLDDVDRMIQAVIEGPLMQFTEER